MKCCARKIKVEVFEQVRGVTQLNELQSGTTFNTLFTCYADVENVKPVLIHNGNDSLTRDYTHKLTVRYNNLFLKEQLYVELNGWRGEVKQVLNNNENNQTLIVYVRRLDDRN